MNSRTRLPLLAALAAFALLLTAGPAAAAEPWWSLNTSARPATIQPGGEGSLVVRASNVGNSCTAKPNEQGDRCGEGAEGIPSTLSLEIPPGTEVVEKEGVPQVFFTASPQATGGVFQNLGLTGEFAAFIRNCTLAARLVSCSTLATIAPGTEFESEFENIATLNPYEYLEIRVKVKDESAAPGAKFTAEASGGGVAPLVRSRTLPIGPNAPAFGAEEYALVPEQQGGAIDTRAGSHPYQLTTTFNLNQNAEGPSPNSLFKNSVEPPRLARNLAFNLPPGQIGNALALPKCDPLDFTHVVLGGEENLCPQSTVIGVATVTLFEPTQLGLVTYPVPLFNLEPAFGEPARFGFELAQTPVTLDTSLRSGPGEDYGVSVSTANVSQLVNFVSSTVTFWGTPGDESHDSSRGWSCLMDGYLSKFGGRDLPCEPQKQAKPPAFLTLPTDCAAPFATSVSGESWTDPVNHPVASTFPAFNYSLEDGAGNLEPLSACNQVPFAPTIHSEPTSNSATSPTGLNFEINVDDEGLGNPGGLAQSQLKKAVVTLPQGFTANPSVAEGLKACSEAEYDAATVQPGTGCTEESKVGDVEIDSPLVEPKVLGSIYVAKQHDNPNHNLLTLYMIARNPEIGVLIRQALRVTPDPVTGQLSTEVDDVPELPFSHFRLSFRQGQRSPLVTPPSCDSNPSEPGDQPYTVEADLYPWSNPSAPVHEHSSFQITQGPEGQGCPSGGVPPFHPNLEAGTQNNAAGTYSPFYTHITRRDSEQEITHFSIKLPPGVVGKLAGVAQCSDAQVAAAKAREHEGGGGEEEANPSCPAGSEVGHTLVGTGVGNVLAYAPGKLYLAGPYHGSAISIVSITAAKVGPFDLGTVVVREALRVNPETAEVFVDATGSDPIPHIVDGIPVHLRDIRIYVNRPEFVLNPTSCEPTSTASTVLGSGLNFATEADDVPVTITSRFQAADCASLPFGPRLGLKLIGGTRRGAHPALKATLHMNGIGEAAIARAQVTLPHSEFLDQAHIGTVCTRVQFKEGTVPGEKCPAASVYGFAKAITPILSEPLEGPVYLRSSEHKLPDLVAALHNAQVDIALDGRIDSVNGQIRNTFEAVPDAPVTKFTLEMQGGSKGLLVNSTNLCQGTHKAIVDFTGHNGKIDDFRPALKAKCGKARKKHGKHGRRR